MAILQAVAIRDEAMQAFNRPFFCPTIGMGIRAFEDECRNQAEGNPMVKHPSDFSLFHIGSFDEASARMVALDVPVRLTDARSVLSNGG